MSAERIPGLSEASGSFEGTYDASVWQSIVGLMERDIVLFPKGMRPWHPMLTSRGTVRLQMVDNADGTTSAQGDFDTKWPFRHEHVGVTRWAKHVWKTWRNRSVS